ncbi:hypothetical protein NQ315_009170 [Exocentrus adspersus]|uniref:Uncharacterized protein n=1 Tax=Exocentrus adspersus TaxID=1586481 RepID=A0AAV8WGY9_9CUCU|nr:hypothetical protein NQ315_009170 [Exocentrus adspersus]
MVNYVLSFCKITGASKIFRRNFYLPLLKPLTPKEALRTLRITGKWLLGAKRQHYIPVLLNHEQRKSRDAPDYGKQQHEIMDDYTYMTPVLDPENESQRILINVLESKDNKGLFVYTVEDKKYNIVLQAQFELAVRDGDIRDILVSQKNDKIIVKMRDFKKVPMEIQYFEGTDELICGEGATSPEEEKLHHHGKYTMSLAKIFEEKEMLEEKWEEELKKMMKRRKKRKWENSKAYKEMMKRNMKNMDWKKFEEDAKKVIEEINQPATEIPIEMEIDDLDATKNVNETILRGGPEMLNQLPTLTEIPDIIKNLGSASLHEIEDTSEENDNVNVAKKRRVSGVKVTLPSGKECFVSGQIVHTEDGEVFVPGQTIQNEYGEEYAPGITININDKPTLVNGLIMGEEERDPMFLPSQSTITADGQLTFASVPEERPPPQPESEKKLKRRNRKKQDDEKIEQTDEQKSMGCNYPQIFEFDIIDTNFIFEESESEEKSTDESYAELNNSEIEELDIEAIRLKQEQQRLELEKLKLILLDDGMDDLIASLEDKKAQLNKKLEELRKLNVNFENNMVTYVNESDALEIAAKITEDKVTIIRISDILLTMTRRAATFRDKNNVRSDNINNNSLTSAIAPELEHKFNACSNKLQVLLKTALVAANEVFKNRPKDQLTALTAIGEILIDALKANKKLLEELINLMQTQFERNEICEIAFKQLTQVVEDTKIAILNTMANKNLAATELQEFMTKILGTENIINLSFAKLIKVKPEIIRLLKENVNCQLKNVKTEDDAVDALQGCIVTSTKYWMDKTLDDIREENKDFNLIEFVEEAASFAKALGLEEVVTNLSNAKYPLKLNCYDRMTTDMLKRMILIKQLAERDYSLKTAITRIKKNPECAKSDPRIRQLIRESAALISDLSVIRNAREIPLQLMKSGNLLAIEDFLLKRTKFDYPVLISRGTMQAVIPKDAARGVLAGRVPYILLDESGVTNFKPMHMMSGMQLNKNRERRIDDYLSGVSDRSSDRDEARSYLQAKNNVRRLQKMFNNHRQVA